MNAMGDIETADAFVGGAARSSTVGRERKKRI